MWEERLKIYDELIELCPNIKRKGKTMPYTSDNGYMFTLLNKAGEIGIRLPKASARVFMEKYNTGEFRSYGAVMRDYVLVTDELLQNLDLLAKYVEECHAYVQSLPPK